MRVRLKKLDMNGSNTDQRAMSGAGSSRTMALV